MYKEFWNFLVRGYGHIPMMLLIGGVSAITSLLEGFNIGLLIPLLDALDPESAEPAHWISIYVARAFDTLNVPYKLYSILLCLGCLVILAAGLKYIRFMLVNKLRIDVVIWLQSKYVGHLLEADISYYHATKVGEMTDTIIQQCPNAAGMLADLADCLFSLTMIIAYLLIAFLIAPELTAGALIIFVTISWGLQYFVSRAMAIGETVVIKDRALLVSALESLTGIQVIKSYLLERLRWSDFNKKTIDLGVSNYGIAMNASRMLIVQEIGLFFVIGFIILAGVTVLGLEIFVMAPLLYSLYRLMPRVAQANAFRHSLAGSMGAVRAVSSGIRELSDHQVTSGDLPVDSLSHGVSLDSVYFGYNKHSDVLKGTSFHVEKGQMIGIVGASGAGKTTLLDLLQRFYDPNHGNIFVDGRDLKGLKLADWRKLIAVVSQDVFLFNETVANNISLGLPNVTQEQIVCSAKKANAHDFIVELPLGYDTNIGDRGWNLSGGQRQRIALARSLIKQPQILILDEATSSLDSDSERLIQESINDIRGTCMMIVVAHRLSTIRRADKILVLQDGEIIEEGNWDALISLGGVFANFYHIQSG